MANKIEYYAVVKNGVVGNRSYGPFPTFERAKQDCGRWLEHKDGEYQVQRHAGISGKCVFYATRTSGIVQTFEVADPTTW